MSSFLRRLSSSYRTAVAHEAAGDYIEAAKAYALCDEPHKVAEMHILEASRRAVPGSAVGELLIAVNLLSDDPTAPPPLLKRLGESLLRVVRSRDLVDSDRELLVHAGRMLARAGDVGQAADAYERAGDIDQAVSLLSQAGEVERVEKLLTEEAHRRERAQQEKELFGHYETALRLGKRDEAVQSLRRLTETALDPREPQRLLDELSRRILAKGFVELQLQRSVDGSSLAEERILFASPPILLGRGDECLLTLADPGVSRQHARIQHAATQGFVLTDLGSKNGTFLDGVRLMEGASLPLRQEGELGIGQHVRLQFLRDEEQEALSLRVKAGTRRGLRLRCAPGPFWLGGGLRLGFELGRPILQNSDGELKLDGQRVPSGVQLIRGDVLQAGSLRIEVL